MKAIKNVGAVIIIVILSVLLGLLGQFLKNTYDEATYPRKFSEFVEEYAKEYRVPEKYVYAVIKCESDFDSAVVSSSGAIGLMQIMPSTFDYLAKKLGNEYESGMLYDPKTNIRHGTYYLSILYDRFGVWETAFAAYNCGPSRVQGWIDEGKVAEDGRLTEIPIGQTARYVEKVAAAAEHYEKLYYSK